MGEKYQPSKNAFILFWENLQAGELSQLVKYLLCKHEAPSAREAGPVQYTRNRSAGGGDRSLDSLMSQPVYLASLRYRHAYTNVPACPKYKHFLLGWVQDCQKPEVN